jgi:hypothetical protein
LSEASNITVEIQIQAPSEISSSQTRIVADLFEADLHQAAMGAAKAKFYFCRAGRRARHGEARRVLSLLADGQQKAIESVQRLRTGAGGAL